ncbi:MAG: Rid family detoxifying hydrolase [Bacteroidia bacterium]
MMKLIFCLLLASFCGISQNNKEVIFTDKAPKPIGPYSQAIMAGNTLYVAGQVGIKPGGDLDTTSIENETKQALQNIKSILEAAKMELSNVVKTTIYVTDLKNFKKINDTYTSWFQEAPPARETVEVKALPKGARIEISVIAVK